MDGCGNFDIHLEVALRTTREDQIQRAIGSYIRNPPNGTWYGISQFLLSQNSQASYSVRLCEK